MRSLASTLKTRRAEGPTGRVSTWETVYTGPTGICPVSDTTVACGDGKCVMLVYHAGSLCYGNPTYAVVSTDGYVTNTVVDLDVRGLSNHSKICYGNGLFVSIGRYSPTYAGYSSDPTGIWNKNPLVFASAILKQNSSIVYGDGTYVVSARDSGGSWHYSISTDPSVGWSSFISPYPYDRIRFVNGLFITNSTTTIYYASSLGGVWSSSAAPSIVTLETRSITYGDNKWIVSGLKPGFNGGYYAYSTSISTPVWTEIPTTCCPSTWNSTGIVMCEAGGCVNTKTGGNSSDATSELIDGPWTCTGVAFSPKCLVYYDSYWLMTNVDNSFNILFKGVPGV